MKSTYLKNKYILLGKIIFHFFVMLSPFLQFGLSCLSFHIYFCFSQNYFKYFLVLQFHLLPKISPLICRFFLFAFNMKHQNYSASKFRSSHPELLCKKGIFRNFTKFTRKHPCQRLFFKVAGLRAIFVAFSLISLLLVSKNFFSGLAMLPDIFHLCFITNCTSI